MGFFCSNDGQHGRGRGDQEVGRRANVADEVVEAFVLRGDKMIVRPSIN